MRPVQATSSSRIQHRAGLGRARNFTGDGKWRRQAGGASGGSDAEPGRPRRRRYRNSNMFEISFSGPTSDWIRRWPLVESSVYRVGFRFWVIQSLFAIIFVRSSLLYMFGLTEIGATKILGVFLQTVLKPSPGATPEVSRGRPPRAPPSTLAYHYHGSAALARSSATRQAAFLNFSWRESGIYMNLDMK